MLNAIAAKLEKETPQVSQSTVAKTVLRQPLCDSAENGEETRFARWFRTAYGPGEAKK